MSEPAGSDARRRALLLLKIIELGALHIRSIVAAKIRSLYQALLPIVWKHFQHLTGTTAGPVARAVRRAAASLIRTRLVRYCCQAVAAWLGKYFSAGRKGPATHQGPSQRLIKDTESPKPSGDAQADLTGCEQQPVTVDSIR